MKILLQYSNLVGRRHEHNGGFPHDVSVTATGYTLVGSRLRRQGLMLGRHRRRFSLSDALVINITLHYITLHYLTLHEVS